MKTPIVLLVEDNTTQQELAGMYLGTICTLLVASTIAEAESIFSNEPYLCAIIMDGRVPYEQGTPVVHTIEFTKTIMARKKPCTGVFAFSGDTRLNDELITLGCQPTDKFTAYKTVRAHVLACKNCEY